MERVDLGAVGLGAGDVGDVDGVLGQQRAAEVAAPEVVAAVLVDAAERVRAALAEVDGEREALRVAPRPLPHRRECPHLAEIGLERRRAWQQRLLGAVVVGVERRPVDGGGPVRIVEDLRRCAQLHVGVDQGAAAHPGGGQHREVLHQPQIEHPAGVQRGMPKRERRLRGPIRVVAGTEASSALEHAYPTARLRQAAGGDSATEAGADHHRVIGVLHDW